MSDSFLIYGSYGYTGELICELAYKKGLHPIIAGRDEQKLKLQAEKYGFEYEAVEIDDTATLQSVLSKVKLVLNCAGPFSQTAKQMATTCLATKTHYLDITGEWQVFEMLAAMDSQAKEAGIILFPGVGYDVVPSDCLALYLKEQMPDADKLSLAIYTTGGKLSRGTKLTMAEGIGNASAMRQNGKIVAVPLAKYQRPITFAGKTRLFMSIPWGDIATAWYSTHIPNIITYTGTSPAQLRSIRLSNWFGFILRLPFIKQIAKERIHARNVDMTAEMRQKAISYVWGEVENAQGNQKRALLTLPDGYLLTAMTSVAIVEKVLNGEIINGFQTPAKAFGSGFILEMDGTKREDL